MSDFYISGAGSDTASGTITTPWRSISRLNAAFASGKVTAGDRVFFERGATFYGKIQQPDTINPAQPGWLRISSYGNGAERPIISGYKLLNTAAGWTAASAGVWQINLSTAGAGSVYTGYDNAQGGDADVGFLKVDGVIHGVRRWSIAALTSPWDFYCSGTTLYVRSSANPTTLAADIRAAVDGAGTNLRSGVDMRELHITGHGSIGIEAPGLGGSTRCRAIDNEISEVGGSLLDGFGAGTTRYGNGIQAWVGSNNMRIEGNIIHDCYDAAWTLQGGDAGVANPFTDILYRRNLTYRNSQSAEYWYAGAGPGFVNCRDEYNTNLFAGYGWGGDVRPETQSRVHVLTFAWNSNADIVLNRNIYYDGRGSYRYSDKDPVGMSATRNIILLRPGTKMLYQDAETIENAHSWAADNGRDTSSTFVVLPISSDTAISNSEVQSALTSLDELVPGGRVFATANGLATLPIHGYWRALSL